MTFNQRLDSSEATPSDHSSLYDALLASRSSKPQRVPAGTPLFTITEQKSVATLATVPSNLTFQRRILSLQHPASTAALSGSGRKDDHHGSVRRRQCVSLDETAIQKLHQPKEPSQATSSGLQSLASQSPQRPATQLPQPVQPPFEPPERVKTPEGVPSWRGQVSAPGQASSASSTPGLLFRQLRARSSRVFRQIFGLPPQHGPPPIRIWRPPVSGHSTLRYGELETHPFAAGYAEANAGQSTNGDIRQAPGPELIAQGGLSIASLPNGLGVTKFRPQNQDHTQEDRFCNSSIAHRILSPSQRALQAATGNVIPVSPQRAQRVQAVASNPSRSVSVPNASLRAIQTPTARAEGNGLPAAENGTMRTIELIEQFPVPPNLTAEASRGSGAARTSGLYLFPRTNDQDPEVLSTAKQDLPWMRVKRRPRANAISVHSTTTNTPSKAPNRAVSGHSQSGNVAGRTIQRDEDLTSIDEPARPSIRGESSTRYRHSGTPVYNEEAASLRSFDAEDDHVSQHRLTAENAGPIRVASAQTTTSRYFSAASTALGTRALSPTKTQTWQNEHARALANGALRFGSGSGSANRSGGSSTSAPPVRPAAAPVSDENTFPLTPVAVTRASQQALTCRHHRADLASAERDRHRTTSTPVVASTAAVGGLGSSFDGTSPTQTDDDDYRPPVPPKNTIRLPPAPVSPPPAGPARSITITQQPSVESFAHRHHIRNQHRIYDRGTWRTRMKRTKCWRCELKARQTASREALNKLNNDFGVVWRRWWKKTKARLEWTCFCKYKAYEDDDDDTDAGTDRVRMGRMERLATVMRQ
ncbi:hypothetical protein LTR37_012070 [Vermiconidia calcicola]|uniref:Uncharacterized protein n=1 Tax=Vermiconidia calcicola TaxID=1690605 RepID=A0ACC3N0B2_9PEZI|nr:hypothetical protein LTR37_012070 [Vermiconidia calcicola]